MLNIKFTGKSLSTGKMVESDSILQGRNAKGPRVFLKSSIKGHWIECVAKTVNQIQ